MRGQFSAGVHRNAHAHLVHVQLAQLAHNFLFEFFRRFAPFFGEGSSDTLGLRELFAILLAQGLAAVVRVFEGIKLRVDFVAVGEDFGYRAAIFLL